jgi:FkbM family methyltransferase
VADAPDGGAAVGGYTARVLLRALALCAVAVAALACRAAEHEPLPEIATAPLLLHDEADLQAYLDAFPSDEYQVHEVPGLGRFYIDDPDERIKKYIVEGRRWEEHIIEVLEEHVRPGSVVVDVGAHIGTHTLTMSRLVGPSGRVYAFEPVKKIYRELRRNLELNGVTNVVALRYALGKGSPTVIEMNPIHEGEEGGTAVGHGGDAVELRSLDSFGLEQVSLIKIDVEGFELPVLDGAEETIRRNRPVLVVEILGGYDYETAPEQARMQIDVTRWRIGGLGYSVDRIWKQDFLGLPKD